MVQSRSGGDDLRRRALGVFVVVTVFSVLLVVVLYKLALQVDAGTSAGATGIERQLAVMQRDLDALQKERGELAPPDRAATDGHPDKPPEPFVGVERGSMTADVAALMAAV